MWKTHVQAMDDGKVQRIEVSFNDSLVSYGEVLTRWRSDNAFRSFFISFLAAVPFSAFRWETPPITSDNRNRSFEFAVLQTEHLARAVDQNAFADQFGDSSDIVTFPNLGGDALMVVPCPIGAATVYGHLASFIRGAPPSQVHHLWQAVGEAMVLRLGNEPIWLSTAGMGVSWLHVRLDSRPKYYGFAPYKDFF